MKNIEADDLPFVDEDKKEMKRGVEVGYNYAYRKKAKGLSDSGQKLIIVARLKSLILVEGLLFQRLSLRSLWSFKGGERKENQGDREFIQREVYTK